MIENKTQILDIISNNNLIVNKDIKHKSRPKTDIFKRLFYFHHIAFDTIFDISCF